MRPAGADARLKPAQAQQAHPRRAAVRCLGELCDARTAHDAWAQAGAVLVDCLTLWLSNLMAASRDIAAETTRLAQTLPRLEGRAVLVSNEVGLGVVPEHALGREFRDHAGRLNQAVAAAVDEAVFIAAGLPLRLKP